MKIVFEEWIKGYALHKNEDVFCKLHTIEGEDFDTIFRKIYAMERSDRYSHNYYKFRDFDVGNAYQNWKSANVTIDMYYGNATVD